ncbi:SDR family NAD(P)-dependent oxidoreductase [Peribacillus frigoritolerans]|uniref:SDR family NAD(P)-dependent oxidoreductase n=1 Tax=Peribacillus frigoritolerans TaxID=450367 RepID=UPI0034411970
MKEVILWTGAEQIGMAIARRIGFGKKIIIGDKNLDNAKAIAKIMEEAGFDVVPVETDISSRESILKWIAEGQKYGEINILSIHSLF